MKDFNQAVGRRFCGHFEEPEAVLSVDVSAIELSAPPDIIDGKLHIQNLGGSLLKGKVFAAEEGGIYKGSNRIPRLVSFSEDSFESNDLVLDYEIDVSSLMPKDIFKALIHIETNGGTVVIPVFISIETPFISDHKSQRLFTLLDYALYAKEEPKHAAALFKSLEFGNWLDQIKCKHINYYYKLLEDRNAFRAVDNFLRACGLKEKAMITLEAEKKEIKLYYQSDIIEEHFIIKKLFWGYLHYDVTVEQEGNWLLLSKKEITGNDFDKSGSCLFDFKVNPAALPSGEVQGNIAFSCGNERHVLAVHIIKPQLITIRSLRENYALEDKGFLAVRNYSGQDILAEIITRDEYVKFASRKYLIADYAEIPFDIKIGFLTQLNYGKRPVYETQIELKVILGQRTIKKKVRICCGSLLV